MRKHKLRHANVLDSTNFSNRFRKGVLEGDSGLVTGDCDRPFDDN